MCTKMSYKKKRQAEMAGKCMKIRGKVSASAFYRGYYCKECNSWHLTFATIHEYENNVARRFNK